MENILKKMGIVHDWFSEIIGGEYLITNEQASKLLEKLEDVNRKNKMIEEEIAELCKKIRIRIVDDGEYRLTDKQAEEIAHEIYLQEDEI